MQNNAIQLSSDGCHGSFLKMTQFISSHKISIESTIPVTSTHKYCVFYRINE